MAAANPWRFSSEYADDDTATVYYNYRHYEPVTGGWVQRDVVGDAFSWAPYSFVRNDPILNNDYIGNAPQYIYEDVTLTYENGRMQICISPDWDYGDFDVYLGRLSHPSSEGSGDGFDELLDLLGIVDPSPACDGLHALIYAGRGDVCNACFSLCACIPLGDLAKVGKYVSRAEKASEGFAKSLARKIEKDLGKDARRKFHDLKRDGIDRTKDELIEDAKSIYEEYGKLFNGGSMK